MTVGAARRVASLALALLVCTAVSAQAQAPSPEARALDLYQAGRAAYEEGDLARAVARFEESLALYAHPNTLLNLGLTYERLNQYRRAVSYLERYLSSGWATDAGRIRVRVARLRTLPSELRLVTTPPGALAYIDGSPQAAGGTPLVMQLAPGAHRVRVELEGHATIERAFEAGLGEPVELRLELRAEPATLELTSSNDAYALEVDGSPVGSTDRVLAVEAGTHRVLARGPAGAVRVTLPTQAGTTSTVALEIEPAPPPPPPPAPPCTPALDCPRSRHALPELRTGFALGAILPLAVDKKTPAMTAGLRVDMTIAWDDGSRASLVGLVAELVPLERTEQGHASRTARGAWASLRGMFGLEWRLARGLRGSLRAGGGVAVLLGVPEGGRLPWFPEDTYAREGSVLAPALALDATARFDVNRRVAITLTPVSFEHVLPRGGLAGLPSGWTLFAATIGSELRW